MTQGFRPTYRYINYPPNSPPIPAATEDYLTLSTGIFRNNPCPREEGRTDGSKTEKERTGNPSLAQRAQDWGREAEDPQGLRDTERRDVSEQLETSGCSGMEWGWEQEKKAHLNCWKQVLPYTQLQCLKTSFIEV